MVWCVMSRNSACANARLRLCDSLDYSIQKPHSHHPTTLACMTWEMAEGGRWQRPRFNFTITSLNLCGNGLGVG
jgi:hypothetical protein